MENAQTLSFTLKKSISCATFPFGSPSLGLMIALLPDSLLVEVFFS